MSSQRTSHPQLPSPQSPNTRPSYIQGQDHSPSATDYFPKTLMMTQTIKCDQHVSSFITPESSPLTARIRRSPLSQLTSAPSSPRRTTSTLECGSGATTPIRSHQTAPQSRLSSPFVEQNPPEDQTPTKFMIPQKSLSSPPVSSLASVFAGDVFSHYNPQSQPLLIAPSPFRLPTSESDLLADPNLPKIEESGLHHPDYLQTTQRTPSPLVNSSLLGDPFSHSSVSISVTETPARGRRLKIFQETSEESFEESLMIHGYAHRSGVSHDGQLSQTALEWLRHPTSTTSPTHQAYLPAIPSIISAVHPPQTENETRKRKRLESFLIPTPHTSKLRIVDIEGRGRVLLSVEEEPSSYETLDGGNPAQRKRTVGKRKLRGNGKASPSKRDRAAPPGTSADLRFVGPDWLDAEFPWSLNADQLVRAHGETQDEKMRWIRKFLDRDSDSESEDEEIMPSTAWGELYQHPPMPCRRGRGKMVPIKATDRQRTGTMVFPSDPADARAALLSRQAVRTLVLRRASQARRSSLSSDCSQSGEDGDFCVCEGKVKDRGLVQCTDCERWYHLRCIGVRNAGELGRPSDPWYCAGCVRNSRQTVTPEPTIPSSEPTIVPTDDDCPESSPKDPLFFVGDPERSPFTAWRPRMRPSTPIRDGAGFEPASGSSSTAYSNKGGPSTPQTSSSGLSRIYETPHLSVNINGAESIFDLTTTPSRGMKFSTFTPKSTGPWSFNPRTNPAGISLHTPLRKHTGSFNRTMGRVDSVSGIAHRPVLQDSPTRRKEGGIGRVLHSRRPCESPMGLGGPMGAGRFSGFPMLEESPVVRSAGKKRMREEADLGDGVSAEE